MTRPIGILMIAALYMVGALFFIYNLVKDLVSPQYFEGSVTITAWDTGWALYILAIAVVALLSVIGICLHMRVARVTLIFCAIVVAAFFFLNTYRLYQYVAIEHPKDIYSPHIWFLITRNSMLWVVWTIFNAWYLFGKKTKVFFRA